MRLQRLVAVSITPVVLIVGVLALVLLHFHSTLLLAEQTDQLAQGNIRFQAGQMQVNFNRDSGDTRPAIFYGQTPVLQYIEWSSSVVVDGVVYSLWDETHGYSFDGAHREIVSTASGPGWQVVQQIALDGQGVTVSYSFVALSGTPVHHVELALLHERTYWLAPHIAGDRFTGGITSLPVSALQTGAAVQPAWQVTLDTQPAAGTRAGVALVNQQSAFDAANGTSLSWASGFTTTYTFDNPQPNMLTPVAAERISIAPVGQPSGG